MHGATKILTSSVYLRNQKVYFHFWKHTANKLLLIEIRGPVVLMVRHPR